MDEMLADMFIKGLGTTKVVKLCEMARIQDCTVCEWGGVLETSTYTLLTIS